MAQHEMEKGREKKEKVLKQTEALRCNFLSEVGAWETSPPGFSFRQTPGGGQRRTEVNVN